MAHRHHYAVIEAAADNFESETNPLYTQDLLREVLLGLRSICVGSESKSFNGHTNITSDRFLVFGVKELLNVNTNVKDALFRGFPLFGLLSVVSTVCIFNAICSAVRRHPVRLWAVILDTPTVSTPETAFSVGADAVGVPDSDNLG